jgi:tetratricopeptide (TPR) repeat protein
MARRPARRVAAKTRPTRLAFFLLAAWLCSCSGFFDPAPDQAISKKTWYEYRRLPDLPCELLDMARDRYADEGPAEEIHRVLLAGCKAMDLEPQSAEAHFHAARACGWLVDFGEQPACYDARRERTILVDCVELAEQAVALEGENAEYRYALAINMGLKMEHASLASASLLISPLMTTLKKVIKLDRSLDQGGALRILGALYLKAPPWPTGPGDLDKALDLLEKAVTEFPDHPLNHLFYAEALAEDESPDEALEEVAAARTLLDPERFSWRAERWERRVDRVERRIREQLEE